MENNNTALNGVKMMIADGIVTQEAAEKYFPELKESEDEKILRVLKEGFEIYNKGEWYSGITNEQILAWLEKQGEYKLPKEVLKIRQELYQSGYNDGYKHGCEDSKKQDKQILANSTKTCEDEQKTVEWHREDEQNLNTCLSYIPDEYLRRWLMDIVHVKYDKPADKVEPKFHKGEWIVWQNKLYKVNDNGCGYELIDQKGLRTSLEYGTVDKSASKFTIQDAKDGDVLATSNYIYIFNSIDKETETVAFYCVMKKSDEYFSFGDYRIHDEILNSVPATKEQCDTLIKAMVKAGCEFDFEKKEFKKIEQKSTDMIESTPHNYITPNKQFFQWIYDRLIYVHNENPNVDYMLSLKERIENMQKPTWSEEDEMMIDETLYFIREYQQSDKCKDENDMQNSVTCENWLKSLKDRIGG